MSNPLFYDYMNTGVETVTILPSLKASSYGSVQNGFELIVDFQKKS